MQFVSECGMLAPLLRSAACLLRGVLWNVRGGVRRRQCNVVDCPAIRLAYR